MLVSLIVAVDEGGGIGYRGQLSWRLSGDLRRFKQLTMGHHILMGRKTYESIGKVLPGRKTIIITRNSSYQAPGSWVAPSVESGLHIAEKNEEEEAFVIGGGEIFRDAMDKADRIYLTRVHAVTPADTFFPNFDIEDWIIEESSIHEADEKNEYPSSFMVLVRKERESSGTGFTQS
jgi:dihydrofolate reductase